MIRPWLDGNNQLTDANGDPLAAGTVTFYSPGTSTRVASYPTAADAQARTNALPLTITLGADGSPQTAAGANTEVWLSGDCDVVVLSSAGATRHTADGINPASIATSESLANPSFEDSLTGTWNVLKSDGVTAGVLNTDYALVATNLHGALGLKLIGAAIAESVSLIPHSPDEDLILEMVLGCSIATAPAQVIAKFYTGAGAYISPVTLYTNSATNPVFTAPALATGRIAAASVPATAAYYTLKLLGGTAAGSDYAIFDGIRPGPPPTVFGAANFAGDVTFSGLVNSVPMAENKGVSFDPSTGTAITNARLTLAMRAETTLNAGVGTGFASGIFSTATVDGVTGRHNLTFTRALATKYQVFIQALGSGVSQATIAFTGATTAQLTLYDNAGVAADGPYSLQIWEFD